VKWRSQSRHLELTTTTTTTTTTTDLFVPCMKGKKISNSIVLFTSLISGTGPNK